MADFKTHITTSTVLGVGYGLAGYYYLGLPAATCTLSAGLCGLAGMLPDLDSDSGVPVRETSSLAAAVAPMLMIDRFASMGWTHESIVLAGAAIYLIVRFGLVAIFKRFTVHRGMWHSIPAALTAGMVAFLLCSCEDYTGRLFKAAAVVLGFVSHLVLDEFWSIQVKGLRIRVKNSFGSALKFWSDSPWANISTYGKLVLVTVLAMGDPLFMHWMGYERPGLPGFAQEWVADVREKSDAIVR